MLKTIHYGGHNCCVLENDTPRLIISQSIGPRIISFGFKDDENLFAEFPDFVTKLPQGGVFHFYGGHRLWQAPEDLGTTYIPEDDPVEISSTENGLLVAQPLQPKTGLDKLLEIVLIGETQVTVTHRIINHGLQPMNLAPWAITQFRTGGMANLPQAGHFAGFLPNRSLALWSYTDMSNQNVKWGKEYIMISAQMESRFKVGFANPRRWLAYWLDGTLFVKYADYAEKAQYYDFNSSSECYCNDKSLELETHGPVMTLEPNETAAHLETWDLYKDVECPQNEDDLQSLVVKLGLE